MDDLVNNLMLQITLNIDQSKPEASLAKLAQLNQAPIKAYVVGSDVTTQQMLDKKKIQNATL